MTDVVEVQGRPARRENRRSRSAVGGSARSLAATILPGVVFCVIAVPAWEIMARTLASPLVPGVAEIGGEIRRITLNGLALQQIVITLWRVVLGFIAAFAVALVVGIPAARSVIVRRFFEPAIVLGLTVPGLVWALLCVIWFGVSLATPVVSIALGIAPALILQIIHGIHAIDSDIVEMAHVFKLSRWAKLRSLWFPALVPFMLSGTRLGLSLAWKVIVLVEMFGLSNGVGYQLDSEFSAQNVAGVLAWTIVFWIVMAALDYGLIQTLERRATRWRRVSRL
jgi:NitT/TauT family transport system permease protein